ncbi:MAG: DUF4344 domain-containing metallopeptidase [Pyrinomonadaceae bacterium]|nr:DUF4344 domain-containing metallopeptidase [Pyrinomonadaceae bacterium]
MNRQQRSTLAFAVISIVITVSCVYRSGRDSEPLPSPTTATATPEDKTKDDKKFSDSKKVDNGDFIVEHLAVKNPNYDEIDRQIKNDKLLEKAADKLNRSLILPNDIYLKTKDCGEVNAFFDAKEQSVTVCYELMEHFYKVFRSTGLNEQKAYDKMFDAVRFAFLHEIGHALIENYNLPITGNEEDAADRCSAFINLTELGEDGVNAVLAAADAFAAESKNGSSSKRNLADEHLLQEQRFYNSLCMIYGSDTEKYAYILDDNYLPKERAARCPQEYERTVQSWSSLLSPWRKS